MDDAIRKAEILIEALGYIHAFRHRQVVIKLGGSAMEEPAALRSTLQSILFLAAVGLRPVLVHGGGKPIDRAMTAANLPTKKVLGRRYTDEATLAIVSKVLREDINDSIVRQMRELGGRAVSLHTGSTQALFGERLKLKGPDGELVDLGSVGEVNKIDGDLISSFTDAGLIPVLPCLAYDAHGNWLNVNADTAAAAVAGFLKAAKLILLTDTPGILRDRQDPKSLISSLNEAESRKLIAEGIIDSGMIPKVEACFDCLRAGVEQTHVIDGRLRYSLLLEIFTKSGIGTEIRL